MRPAWIACGMALLGSPAALADTLSLTEPACSACEELVDIAEEELGFELGRRVYPGRAALDSERAILPSGLEPNWGDVFQERGGAVKFLNERRTAAVQIWGDVVPVANDSESQMVYQASGRDAPRGALVVGAGIRVGF